MNPFRHAEGGAKSTPGRAAWATHGALLVVQFAFASQAVEAKLAMLPRTQGGEGLLPEALAMGRMLGAAVFFLAAARLSRAPAVRLRAATHAKLVGLAALGVALNQALFLSGLRVSTPFVVSLLGATIPVLTAALAVLFRKERACWRTPVGLLLALSGVLWLTLAGSTSTHPGLSGEADRGAILVFLNSLSYAAYVVFSRDVVRELGPVRLMAWVFGYGALMFAPLGAHPLCLALGDLTPRGAVLLVYIIAIPTILAYGLNAWALARSTATIVTIYIYLQPLLAGLLARIQLGYAVSSGAGFAALLILGGVAVTTLRRLDKAPA